MKKILIQYKRGFTLVELMVVVSVIAILSSIVYANFGQARAAARDDFRKTSLKELEAAIRLYKAQNGFYPLRGCIDSSDSVNLWSGANPRTHASVEQCSNYIVGLVPDYIPALPVDPNKTKNDSGFIYRTDSNTAPTEFKLLSWQAVEVKEVRSYNEDFSRCPSIQTPGSGPCTIAFPADGNTDLNNTYAVFSPGAARW